MSHRVAIVLAAIQLAAFPAYADCVCSPQIPPATAPARYHDWVSNAWCKCEANWDQKHEARHRVRVPDGWQACKQLYAVGSLLGDAGWNHHPRDFDPAPGLLPPKFFSYEFYMRAWGSQNFLNREGGAVRLDHVGIRMIPYAADNNERVALGCAMPSP